MLKSIGVQWALAGHSERRMIFGETDDYINAQCLKIIDEGMAVMLCIGESLEEFEQDLAGSVCAVQLKKGLKGIKKEDLNRVVIAYEPVWAIGKFTLSVWGARDVVLVIVWMEYEAQQLLICIFNNRNW